MSGNGSDIEEMMQDDIDRFRDISSGGMDTSIPAMMELIFLVLTGLTVIVWFLALFLVPDLDGKTWMGLGMIGVIVFGLPAGLIFALRRGGAEIVDRLIRDMIG